MSKENINLLLCTLALLGLLIVERKHMSTFSTKRMNILSRKRDNITVFASSISSSEQREYFTSPDIAKEVIRNFTDNTKVCFI